jgi:GNAT superfamily N-acetyltransferase
MGKSKLAPVDEKYNREMLSILKASPIDANGLSLYFDKSPDIFEIARMKYTFSEHLGYFEDEHLKGFASLGFYQALIKGNMENVFTFYHFYLLPEARGKKIPRLAMKEFFNQAQKTSANFGISITLKGNRSTEAYIGSQPDEWMPPTRVIDNLVVKTILFSKPMKNDTNYKVKIGRAHV